MLLTLQHLSEDGVSVTAPGYNTVLLRQAYVTDGTSTMTKPCFIVPTFTAAHSAPLDIHQPLVRIDSDAVQAARQVGRQTVLGRRRAIRAVASAVDSNLESAGCPGLLQRSRGVLCIFYVGDNPNSTGSIGSPAGYCLLVALE